MTNQAAVPRYSSPLIFLHWLTAGSILLAFILVWSLEMFDLEAVEKDVVFIHKSFGLLVIVLTVLRLLVKLSGKGGEGVVDPDPKINLFSKLGHLGLYGFMFVTPFIGWLKSNAGGREASLFGIPFPTLLEKNRDLADLFGEMHEVTAYLFLALIALHAAAAIWHQVARKDGVMYSMLPMKHLLPK
ncbi:MAG TPA: cytochrome b/b6 domain-containing protein [Pseudomonadales bacterium]|nr:cytochrome b/b6 domain-containing protein [Pseudomonadales bacterium]